MTREGERIFNLFLFIEGGIIQELGVVVHVHQGSDSAKIKFLQDSVASDFANSQRFPLPHRFITIQGSDGVNRGRLSYDTFVFLMQNGAVAGVFEEVFQKIGAPQNPLMCVTPIVDGKPRVEAESNMEGKIETIFN